MFAFLLMNIFYSTSQKQNLWSSMYNFKFVMNNFIWIWTKLNYQTQKAKHLTTIFILHICKGQIFLRLFSNCIVCICSHSNLKTIQIDLLLSAILNEILPAIRMFWTNMNEQIFVIVYLCCFTSYDRNTEIKLHF